MHKVNIKIFGLCNNKKTKPNKQKTGSFHFVGGIYWQEWDWGAH